MTVKAIGRIGVGAYSTPPRIARFLVSWAVKDTENVTIDPCTGDGVFLEEVADRLHDLGLRADLDERLIGVEIDHDKASQTSERLRRKYGGAPKIIAKGFFATLPKLRQESIDAFVGNPPFVRYREFLPVDERELAFQFLKQSGFPPSKLTNAWVPFLVAGINLLKPGGRLAMVMPAELLQVSYAAPLREYLHTKFGFVFVVAFTRLVFPKVEQEVVLVMGTKGEGSGLRLIECRSESELDGSEPDLLHYSRKAQMPVENSREKWTQYFLSDEQRSVLRKALDCAEIVRLGTLASVDVGVVTGHNDFFIVPDLVARDLDAEDHLLPVVTRTVQMQGIKFTSNDWKRNHCSYLLSINPASRVSAKLRQYLIQGQKNGVNKGYKCRCRDPWYVVSSVWVPDAFLFRQIGLFPRLVRNSTTATCTDTIHRVKFSNKKKMQLVVGCFYNSLTMACAEMFGRSYGGGVLELMPTEAEKLPIPLVDLPNKFHVEIESLLRNGSYEEALQLGDREILHAKLGLSTETISVVRSSWVALSKRRRIRKRIENMSS